MGGRVWGGRLSTSSLRCGDCCGDCCGGSNGSSHGGFARESHGDSCGDSCGGLVRGIMWGLVGGSYRELARGNRGGDSHGVSCGHSCGGLCGDSFGDCCGGSYFSRLRRALADCGGVGGGGSVAVAARPPRQRCVLFSLSFVRFSHFCSLFTCLSRAHHPSLFCAPLARNCSSKPCL